MAWRGSGVRIPSAPQKSQVKAIVRIVSFAMEAIVGAMLQVSGMAEAKRRGYGEDSICFDHRRDYQDSVHHKPVLVAGAAWSRSAVPRTRLQLANADP